MLNPADAPDPGRLFSGIDFSTTPAILAAVSGGGDSLAMLILLHRFLSSIDGPRIVAVTVDHGLRAESGAEAEQVGRFCERAGIAHRTMRWSGDKPATGLSAAAREARYRLLAEAADEAGATIIVTGHTADDQAETALMRRARGQGRGLAGMAPATLLEGRIWIVRPLLAVRREALRRLLRGEGVAWIDDPSNENDAYERVRARSALVDTAEFRRTIETVRITADQRVMHGERAASLIATHATMPAPGLMRLDGELPAGADPAAALYALRILLAVAGGREHLPDAGRAAGLLGRLGGGPMRATLARAVVDRRRQGIFLLREGRGLPARAALADNTLWDGRYRLRTLPGYRPVETAALGRTQVTDDAEDNSLPRSLRRAATAGLPALWRGAECIGRLDETPLCAVEARPVAAPWARFLPSFDLTPARAVLTLIGGDLPPSPPYRGHETPGSYGP